MVFRFRLLFLIFVCSLISLRVTPVKFYNVNSLFGISLREVNSVCGDNSGFIWASSKAGVLRLTEGDYRIYHLPYENTNVLTVKLINQHSRLIAYTNNGQIFLFNPIYDRFELLVDLYKVLEKKYLTIHNILVDEKGACWIASSAGFFKYHLDKLTLVYEIKTEKFAVTWYDKQHIIIVRDKGILLFDTQSLISKSIYTNQDISPFIVMSLCFDSTRQKLFIGTMSKGLFSYDFNSNSFSAILESSFPKQPILSIEKKSDSSIFVGVDGQGVWDLDRNGTRVINVYKESIDDPSSLRGNGVYGIYCDPNNRVWVCTYSGGLSFFDQATPIVSQIVHLANNKNSLVNNDVNRIVEDHMGRLWFATNNGISCWDVTVNQWRHLFTENQKKAKVFLSLCEDDKGRIWAGSYSSGVYVLDGKTGKELAHYGHDEKEGPSLSNFIIDIFKDSQGDIWIGGVNGQSVCYQSKVNKFRVCTQEPIGKFAELSPNQILLGCSYGLLLLNKQTGETRILKVGFSVRDLIVVDDNVWICSNGSGLIRYNYKTSAMEKFNTQTGLPSNYVNSIIAVDNYFWIGTENGLCRFNPKDNNFFTYSSIYQLSRTSFNNSSHFKLKNGYLAWGTNFGAIVFDPKLLREMPSKGMIFFQDLSVSGRSIRDLKNFELKTPVDSLKSISLKYYENTISLEVLSIKTTAETKFSWKLDGFDQEWSLPSVNRVVTYTNIPNGNFELRVRLYDNSLSHVLAERSISIKVVPPFWKTIWFWVIIYVVILGMVLFVLQYYIRTLKQKHTEEKIRFFTNTAHDIRTSLTLIKAPVEELSREINLSDAGRHYLGIAIEQARRLSIVVTQLMDFQKVDIGKEQMSYSMTDIDKFVVDRLSMFDSLAKSKDIELVFKSELKNYVTAIDEFKMEKVIDNLITNAIKYSHPKNKVFINLWGDKKKWMLKVKDEGIGISKNAQRWLFKEFYRGENAINSKVVGSGIGLLLVKNYISMHKGTVTFTSHENVGSVFQIEIPYNEIPSDLNLNNRFSFSDLTIIPSIDVVAQKFNNAEDLHEPVMKVLIVEDNDDLLSFMNSTLSREFKVFSSVNGKLALEIINKQMPDLVVSDIMMPEMDGFELCQKLKSTYETSHIPIVLLTALSEKTEQLRGLGLGADDYLTKPFDMNLLIQRIKSIIRNREIVREKALKLIKGDISEPILNNQLNDKFMKKMVDVARSNMSNAEFNKDVFASSMNVSSSLLYKKVKSLTNLSPTDFIKIVRLDHSLELLQSRQYTITEVSEMCGFTSVGYFSTVFRKHFGKSPTGLY